MGGGTGTGAAPVVTRACKAKGYTYCWGSNKTLPVRGLKTYEASRGGY